MQVQAQALATHLAQHGQGPNRGHCCCQWLAQQGNRLQAIGQRQRGGLARTMSGHCLSMRFGGGESQPCKVPGPCPLPKPGRCILQTARDLRRVKVSCCARVRSVPAWHCQETWLQSDGAKRNHVTVSPADSACPTSIQASVMRCLCCASEQQQGIQ